MRKLVLAVMVILLSGASYGAEAVPPELQAEFDRLESKFKGKHNMHSFARSFFEEWKDLRRRQCLFEKAAVDGDVKKPPSLKARQAEHACLARTAAEMKSALSGL